MVQCCAGKVHKRNTLEQLKLVGPNTVSVALLTAAFVGMVFTIQVRLPAASKSPLHSNDLPLWQCWCLYHLHAVTSVTVDTVTSSHMRRYAVSVANTVLPQQIVCCLPLLNYMPCHALLIAF